ncbi:MAG: hypothetical protein IPJ41_08080 [Phycisphaerales bacterium]|nr:hypothetical protein [Phycisphaerales bacterium]
MFGATPANPATPTASTLPAVAAPFLNPAALASQLLGLLLTRLDRGGCGPLTM